MRLEVWNEARQYFASQGEGVCYWLELLGDSGLMTKKMSESILADANELVAILVTALKKLR